LEKRKILWVNWVVGNDFLVICQFGVKQGGCCDDGTGGSNAA
jgi:hypothetical protein